MVSSLRINLPQVRLKLPVIERVKSEEFWEEVTVGDLEEIRDQLSGIIQFRRKDEDHCSLVLTQEPGLDLHNLMDYLKQAQSLDQANRDIIGTDAAAVHERFIKFVPAHPNLA